MAMHCAICNVSCASRYNYDQHVSGKKHTAAVLRKPSSLNRAPTTQAAVNSAAGRSPQPAVARASMDQTSAPYYASSDGGPSQKPCFYWPGRCFKGASCPWYHDPALGTAPPAKAFLQSTAVATGDFVLNKTAAEAAAAAPAPLPGQYRDVLKRKQDVNLYLQGGRVIFQFNFNVSAIAAIKEHVNGRKWEPGIGAKGCWTCPLESLPEAVALYEHMGRKPDSELKSRAKDVVAACGPSAAAAIKLKVELTAKGGASEPSLGRVVASFYYDADVVAAFKQLSPTMRTYEPASKQWTADLLALPELLEHLQPLGYAPSHALRELSEACTKVDALIYPAPSSPPPAAAAAAPAASPAVPSEVPTTEEEADFDAALAALDVDAILASQGSQAYSSPGVPPPAAAPPPAAESPSEEQRRRVALDATLKQLVQLVCREEGVSTVDTSDIGQAKKKRKVTSAQHAWATGGEFPSDGSDDDDFLGSFHRSAYNVLRGIAAAARQRAPAAHGPPPGCDCGQSGRLVGGKHVCRYFGHFACGSCGNRWTSAYCWKDETQACRPCGKENIPIKKEALDGRAGMGTGRAHDSSRCSMCAQLGYDCSLRGSGF